MHAATILLADDDEAICTVLKTAMVKRGYRVRVTDDTGTLIRWVQAGEGDVVITDVLMPKGNGLELLPKIKLARPELPVIVISAQSTLMTAVKATERGAYDYLPKPFDLNVLLRCVENSLEMRRQEPAPAALPADGPLIGTSPAMQEIYRTLARLVPLDLTVLITGESGTGKELVARALHELGTRKHKPFVAINMAAIPRELVESELFGHEKGAFTGASTRKAGLFQQAEGGTLFLDEIGDMPLDAQTRLLRVLQQGEYSTVGGTKPHKTDVRIIGATHRDLEHLVAKSTFREDLYYRLNVVPMRLPPLRKRVEDIPALCRYFLRKAQEKGLPFKALDDNALRVLQAYSWPGNVRELENMMYRLSALNADVRIHGEAVTALLEQHNAPSRAAGAGSLAESARMHLKSHFAQHAPHLPAPGLYDRVMLLVEKPLIELTLKATHYNQLKASKILGINRNTLRKKMDLLGIAKLRGDEEGAA